MKTSSKVVSATPHAWTVNLFLAFSTALKTSAILTSFFGISNFWVPDMWYIFWAFGESSRTILSTSASLSEELVIVNTKHPPYLAFSCFGFPMHCKLPSTKMPIRSQRTSASSIECVVRIIALCCFACLTTFQRLFLEAGSNPVLGSSM
uniref:Uncharacterized protein n=1 Tax=Opuntia streptacantha TaxID=393608 RepID=A0A7C9F3A4_OPUST